MSKESDKSQTSSGYRIDKEPIKNRFPKLGKFEKCYWKADIIGDKSSRVPGPTPYWMKGFVFISKESLEDFEKNFSWTPVKENWKPSLGTDILAIDTFEWLISDGFNEFIKPPSFFGNFYLDKVNGIIYFDIAK
jgi:hypothetical protein